METSIDSEFERVLSLVYPPLDFPDVYSRIFDFNWLPNSYHKESFREHCVYVAHCMEKLCRRDNLLQEIWKEGISYAYLVGFLHDIGKPFVEYLNSFKNQNFTGHAQIGARMVTLRFQDEIPEDILLTMGVLIDCHMCCLRNFMYSLEHRLRVNAVLHMYLPRIPNIFNLLMCLHSADESSKLYPYTIGGFGYLYQSPFSFRKDRRIIIYLIGPSGSGKSSIAQTLTEKLASFGSVLHMQRDDIVMKLAKEGESYSEYIILVDTCQTYYWYHTIGFDNCFRIGVFCVPFNLFDRKVHGKSPCVEFPPKKWSGYPNLLTESNRWSLEVGTGLWNLVPSIVKRYFDQSWPESLDDSPSLATLWNKYSFPAISAQFSFNRINFNKEYLFKDYIVYRATYSPGFDVTWGPTRFYRGEFLLINAHTKIMQTLRTGLPTFNKTFLTTFDSVVVTPKFDGSLVNILFIPFKHPYYKLLNLLFVANINKFGFFLVGSKQKLVMDDRLRKKFISVIGDFDNFISSYASYFKDDLKTLHFEMMTELNSSELNVYYPQNFCKFIGCTTFTNDTRHFTLAKPSDERAISQKTFKTIEECQVYLDKLHHKLLMGDTLCEPEGCVLYFWDAQGRLLDITKSKFPEYLAVINPKKYPEEYQKTLTNPLLAQRFQKIRNIKEKLNTTGLKNEIYMFLDKHTGDRKDFALYVHSNSRKISEFQSELQKIANAMRIKPKKIRHELFRHYPSVENTLLSIFARFDEITEKD
ncbi:uncharacterized protein TNCT_171622 [Trichonephila clavata]|uniref:HD domain-containing protein n=1 Tax=Trichonephila clavata TaxID=2740835 RepID=A0A8X6G4I3_TRICU|nr:uncharacterized protein TNCT_171622 [Trichonephila clavata]